MRELFGCEVGLSDHTLGTGVATGAVVLGATVIEKHFTLCRADGGIDSAFSLEPGEMRSLVQETKRAWQALGHIAYGPSGNEKKSLVYRRSLYVTKDIKAGEIITKENMRAIRPGFGLAPKYFEIVTGRSVKKDVKAGTPVEWDLF